ncbi:MAG: cbb3-type cytochrome c oxidase subunit I [Sphingobacteriaceae bacterium]|nr:cbb3-type cytochrome c oxidase subunit I [Sphingobacteriaceae bacterium]
MKKELGIVFIFFALMALIAGMFFGSISSFQFIYPEFLPQIPFYKTRPLHVSMVVSWIFLSAIGGIYFYLPKFCNLPLFSNKLAKLHLMLFIITGLIIIASYIYGQFGGREYWEFPPILSIPIFISWIIFGYNYFKTVIKKIGQWPVYMWMWATGICFFLITFSEAYLWLFPFFRDDPIRDLTVQWKAYGALVGSWNMLVYGTGIFLMEKIKGDSSLGHSKIAFLMYFLGFTNLLFGWAHHIYILPTQPWIRHLSYFISMTELIILVKIIWNWKKSISDSKKNFQHLSYKFIVASDFWILFNLILAILISIPAINVYTHGTHVTVAHAMGSSIGINTMILLSSVFFIIKHVTNYTLTPKQEQLTKYGFWILNISLFVFLASLIWSGIIKGVLIIENKLIFQEIMQTITPHLKIFTFSGIGLLIGIILICYHQLIKIINYLFSKAQH